jgi:hypothetical protein
MISSKRMGMFVSIFAAASVVLALSTTPCHAGSNVYAPDHLLNFNSGLCLLIQGGSQNTQAVQYTCLNFDDQLWSFIETSDNHWLIADFNSSLCLTRQSNDGVVQASCNPSLASQKWDVMPTSNGSDFQLRNVAAGRCLVTQTASVNTTAFTASCTPVFADQRWYLTAWPTTPTGYVIPSP